MKEKIKTICFIILYTFIWFVFILDMNPKNGTKGKFVFEDSKS